MVGRMVERGYDPDFAQRCFDQIKGFGEYGFPESHAASFAHLVYVSSWLKWKYPAAFAAALLNSQPMGFYAPAQIVRDAREHGVEVRAVDVNRQRLGLHAWRPGAARASACARSKGLRLADARAAGRRGGAALCVGRGCASCAGVPVHAIERLAAADAFRSIELDRRAALWDSQGAQAGAGPAAVRRRRRPRRRARKRAGEAAGNAAERACGDRLPDRPPQPEGAPDAVPARALCGARASSPPTDLNAIRDGRRLSIAGVVLIRQRPGSAKGVCFITIEDETGVANLVIWPDLFERQRKIVMGARLMAVHGLVQKDEGRDPRRRPPA